MTPTTDPAVEESSSDDISDDDYAPSDIDGDDDVGEEDLGVCHDDDDNNNRRKRVIDDVNETPIESTKKGNIDDLWAEMNAAEPTIRRDPKVAPPIIVSINDISKQIPLISPLTPGSIVKVKEVLDFAGEDVVVIRDVVVGSDDYNRLLKVNNKSARTINENENRNDVNPVTLTNSKISSSSHKKTGGIDAVIASIEKKKKLTTLNKSRHDWVKFKNEEGLEDELVNATKNKDSHLQKKNFLAESDWKQYNIEREERLKRQRPLND